MLMMFFKTWSFLTECAVDSSSPLIVIRIKGVYELVKGLRYSAPPPFQNVAATAVPPHLAILLSCATEARYKTRPAI
jgi:hypothetical protein